MMIPLYVGCVLDIYLGVERARRRDNLYKKKKEEKKIE